MVGGLNQPKVRSKEQLGLTIMSFFDLNLIHTENFMWLTPAEAH